MADPSTDPFAELDPCLDPFAHLPRVDDGGPPRELRRHFIGEYGEAGVDFEPWPLSNLAGKSAPVRQWLVPDLIPADTVTLLGGDGGTGKSLLALQLAVAVGTDTAWIGRDVTRGPALFVSAEDDADEIHRRAESVASAAGVDMADLRRVHVFSLAGRDALLARLDADGTLEPTRLFERLEDAAARLRPRLIVLDTLADLFPGNENDRAQARQFVGLLRGLALRLGCAVLLLSHPSLTGMASGSGASGSTAWSNSVRARLYLERVRSGGEEADPDLRRLVTKKSNYGRTDTEVVLRWRAGALHPIVSESRLDREAGNEKADRVFLKLLGQFKMQGRHVNASAGQTYAPRVFDAHPESEGVSKQALKAAMERLLSRGRIVLVADGPPSKRRNHLAIAD